MSEIILCSLFPLNCLIERWNWLPILFPALLAMHQMFFPNFAFVPRSCYFQITSIFALLSTVFIYTILRYFIFFFVLFSQLFPWLCGAERLWRLFWHIRAVDNAMWELFISRRSEQELKLLLFSLLSTNQMQPIGALGLKVSVWEAMNIHVCVLNESF